MQETNELQRLVSLRRSNLFLCNFNLISADMSQTFLIFTKIIGPDAVVRCIGSRLCLCDFVIICLPIYLLVEYLIGYPLNEQVLQTTDITS